jgi:hypothetical protein
MRVEIGLLLPRLHSVQLVPKLLIGLVDQIFLGYFCSHLTHLLVNKVLQVLIVNMFCKHLSLGDRFIVKSILSIDELEICYSVSLIWHMDLIINVLMNTLRPFFNHFSL